MLDVTEELRASIPALFPPPIHGAHNHLPHRQLELLANDELHGLATCSTVIQNRALIITVQSPKVECGLWGHVGHQAKVLSLTKPQFQISPS